MAVVIDSNGNQVSAKSADSISVDDGGFSSSVLSSNIEKSTIDKFNASNLGKAILHANNLYSASEIKDKIYTRTFRYGVMNSHTSLSTGREYLFFTKPDLHILRNDSQTLDNVNNITDSCGLNDFLKTVPFWAELYKSGRKNTTLKALQLARNTDDPFNHLLQNMCISNLDVPGLQSEMIETPKNMYGVGYTYRGSSEASDDDPEFSLEFKDNRYLDTYLFFKAYEEYETLKHHGVVAPSMYYITHKILHDAFSIYKFIVADDMETIVYYGKMYGVTPKSLPRDVFSSPNFDNGITYSIDFKAAFYEDMKPEILADFNFLSKKIYNDANQCPYDISPYNIIMGRADTRPAKAAFVIKDNTSAMAKASSAGFVYKLKWRGSDQI